MTTQTGTPEKGDGAQSKSATHAIYQEDVSLAINAYLMAEKAAQDGNEHPAVEKQQHLRSLQNRYWRIFFNVLSGAIARRRQTLEFTEDERLFLDVGLLDSRMLGGEREQTTRELLGEINSKGQSGCYYLSEWFSQRHQQLQLESALSGPEESEDDYVSQLIETRQRVLSRLATYFTGLPGIPLEVSEAMRSGDLDNAIITAGINALRNPRRKDFLRRRNLWQLREQILAKARARANNQNALRLFEMLNEIYVRDWRERYDAFVNASLAEEKPAVAAVNDNVSVAHSYIDMLMSEARQIRMRTILMGVVDDKAESDTLLTNRMPRLTKSGLAEFLGLVQTFDRSLAELPPILIVPGSGRGFFAWETGCVMLALRPLVSLDDSVATAFAWQHMLDDRFNLGGRLRQAYEAKFPGAVFQNDFPVDYRAWFTRLAKGEINAMNAQRRAFFRDHIGPDLSGPLLPPNLRNIGPQTMSAICRRLEKQLAAGDNDLNLHRRLAALYWQQGNLEAAGLQFNAAMQLAPGDGETLFAAGMFMRSRGDNEAANDCFRFGAERARDSLWGVYCQDALSGQL